MTELKISIAFAAALLLLTSLLALWVSTLRTRLGNYAADPGPGPIQRAHWTHRNAAEHVPVLALLLLLLGVVEAPRSVILAAGSLALVSRLLHAAGYLGRIPPIKITGALLCYTVEILGAGALLAFAFAA